MSLCHLIFYGLISKQFTLTESLWCAWFNDTNRQCLRSTFVMWTKSHHYKVSLRIYELLCFCSFLVASMKASEPKASFSPILIPYVCAPNWMQHFYVFWIMAIAAHSCITSFLCSCYSSPFVDLLFTCIQIQTSKFLSRKGERKSTKCAMPLKRARLKC